MPSSMIRFILVIIGLTLLLNSSGQLSCDISKLSQSDKVLLKAFWTRLKTAVNKKDKASLAELCNFPFECSFCTVDSLNYGGVKVTKKLFLDNQYKIFLDPKLKDEFKKEILSILSPNYGQVEKKCSYRFGYVVTEETNQQPGLQIFFVVEKIHGQYKITSAWTVP